MTVEIDGANNIVKTNTISEVTSANGVTVDGLSIKDSKLVTSNSVIQTNITDQSINEAKMQISNAPTNGYALTAQSGNTGGMTWASVGGTNTPSFFARSSSSQTPSNNTSTLVVLGTEVFDTDSAFASNAFTVPTGKAGKYFFHGNVRTRNTADVNDIAYVNLFLNGSSVPNNMAEIEVDMGSSGKFRNYTQQVSVILDLSVGNTVQLYAKLNVGSGTPLFDVSNFMGYKLI